MPHVRVHSENDVIKHITEAEDVKARRYHNFETGWYVPGIENPAVLAAELDEEEERTGLRPQAFYDLLKSLVDEKATRAEEAGVENGEIDEEPPSQERKNGHEAE